MKTRLIILTALFLSILLACKKDEKKSSCPQQNHYYLSNFTKQFIFKKNSYWILKNPTSGVKDTLKCYFSSGIENSTQPGTSKECYEGDIYEGYIESFGHKMFTGGSTLDISGVVSGLYGGYYSKYNVSPLAIIEHIGDSALYNNNTYWCKLENFYPSITINGNLYNNVYQMYYYPDLYGFKRIWFCPAIGFIKFEFFNTTLSQQESWELDSYFVQ